jgi:hypothetical protein
MTEFLAYICIFNTFALIILGKTLIDAVIDIKSVQNSTHIKELVPWSKEDEDKVNNLWKGNLKEEDSNPDVSSLMENF